jgi:uncharacterized protein (UPF0297 family)
MGAYVLWLEENGYAPTMDRVEQYHKENPNMIPKPREPRETIRKDDVKDTRLE